MSRLTDRKIETLLRDTPGAEPPESLIGKLRDDLPGQIDVPVPETSSKLRASTRRWAWAASFLIALVGGFIGLRTFQTSPPEYPESQRTAAPIESSRQEAAPERVQELRKEKPNATELLESEVFRDAADDSGARAENRRRIRPETPATLKDELPSSDEDFAASETSSPTAERLVSKSIEDVTFRGGSPRVEPIEVDAASALRAGEPKKAKRTARSAADPASKKLEEVAFEPEFEEELAVVGELPEVMSSSQVSTVYTTEVSKQARPRTSTRENYRSSDHPSSATPESEPPYDSTFYRDYRAHAFVDTAEDGLSTFALDVDTASYTIVRRYLDDGHLPPPAAIRVEEMINFFDYGDQPPARGDFALSAEGAPSPFRSSDGNWLLRLHVQGREVASNSRPPVDLIFVVDVSGSMQRENRLELVKQALYLLLDQLRPDDRVALVVYGSRGQVLLSPTGNLDRIRDGIAELEPGGSTNAEEGLNLAYDLATEYSRRGAMQRIVLCSDGVANVGRTEAESLLGGARRWSAKGIELTTVGFGMGNFNDTLMEQLADQGDGRYAYVDDLDEAHRVFVENLTGTLMTIASDARIQVEFDEETVRRYRLVGYENRDMADRDFRNDDADAGEIGAGHGVTALYELDLAHRRRSGDHLGTLRLRYRSTSTGEFEEEVLRIEGRDLERSWKKASRSLKLTSVVAEFGHLLKLGERNRHEELDDLFLEAQELSSQFPGNHEVVELTSLIGRAARLASRDAR